MNKRCLNKGFIIHLAKCKCNNLWVHVENSENILTIIHYVLEVEKKTGEKSSYCLFGKSLFYFRQKFLQNLVLTGEPKI